MLRLNTVFSCNGDTGPKQVLNNANYSAVVVPSPEDDEDRKEIEEVNIVGQEKDGSILIARKTVIIQHSYDKELSTILKDRV
jgi:hypothetical protein